MQNKYLKFLLIALVVAIIIPQITLAAWWNPFTWHWGWVNSIFHFQQTAQKAEKQITDASLNSTQLNIANPADSSKTDAFNFASGRIILNQGTANVVSYTLTKTATGNLNGDSFQDGALAVYQGYGANIIRVILFAIVNNNGKLAQTDYVLPIAGQTMDAEIKSVSISNGILTLNLVLVSAQDQQNLPHYQWKPTIEKTIQYKLINGKLVEQALLGGDVDSHGCIGSAGYTWCEAKQKCLRTWEEKCEAVACTQETKICPDGSAVGRTGPNCEFATCPTNTKTQPLVIIKNKLIGTELSYFNFSGEKQIFKIKEENILNIENVQCGYINYKLVEKDCYRASIGTTSPLWYIYFDKNTLEQVKTEQLFVT